MKGAQHRPMLGSGWKPFREKRQDILQGLVHDCLAKGPSV